MDSQGRRQQPRAFCYMRHVGTGAKGEGAGHMELSAHRELGQPKPCVSAERDSQAISQKGEAMRRGKMYPF